MARKLLEVHDLAICALCVRGIAKGIEALLQCYSLLRPLVHCFPYDAVCLQTKGQNGRQTENGFAATGDKVEFQWKRIEACSSDMRAAYSRLFPISARCHTCGARASPVRLTLPQIVSARKNWNESRRIGQRDKHFQAAANSPSKESRLRFRFGKKKKAGWANEHSFGMEQAPCKMPGRGYHHVYGIAQRSICSQSNRQWVIDHHFVSPCPGPG